MEQGSAIADKPRDTLHHGKRAANKWRERSVW